MLCPKLSQLSAALSSESDSFYDRLLQAIAKILADLETGSLNEMDIAVDEIYLELLKQSLVDFKSNLLTFVKPDKSLMPDTVIAEVDALKSTSSILKQDKEKLNTCVFDQTLTSAELSSLMEAIQSKNVKNILEKLCAELKVLEGTNIIEPGYEGVFRTLMLEDQLLAEIKSLDVNREFYYNIQVEDRLALELNESDKKLNTLMNPLVNYDINNVNNCFVISKLDIDYLDSGIQIARSSRLN
jgi:hypothetical protein